jgi:hypothetical protein
MKTDIDKNKELFFFPVISTLPPTILNDLKCNERLEPLKQEIPIYIECSTAYWPNFRIMFCRSFGVRRAQ